MLEKLNVRTAGISTIQSILHRGYPVEFILFVCVRSSQLGKDWSWIQPTKARSTVDLAN